MENYVGTSGDKNAEITGFHIMTKVLSPQTHLLKRSVHSHPNNNIPSGFDEDRNPGEEPNGDIVVAKIIQKMYPDFDSFEVFRVKSLQMDKYNKDSKKSDFKLNPDIHYEYIR